MERVWNRVGHFSHIGRRGLGTLFEVTQQAFLAATLGALLVFAPLQGQAQKEPASPNYTPPREASTLGVLSADNVLWLQHEISSGQPGSARISATQVR